MRDSATPDPNNLAVGDTGPIVVAKNLERRDFVRFAGASGDFNPIHYDEPHAKEAGNQSVFAQGMLNMGIASRVLTDWFGVVPITRFRVRFQSRAFPGDTLTTTGEIVEISQEDDETVVEVEIHMTNQDDDPVVTGDATLRLPPSK